MKSNLAKPKILLIGALPPPFIGPSVANARLSQSPILNSAFELRFFDISDRRASDNMGRFDFGNVSLGLRHLFAYAYDLLVRKPQLVYLGLSQGFWGYVRDLGFIIPALLLRRRVVLHLRGSEFHSFYESLGATTRQLTQWVFRRVAAVIVLGENLKYIFKELVSAERISVIPNGINCDEYQRPSALTARRPGKKMLFLSSLRKRKGLMLAIEALPAIFEKHPDASITIAGAWRSEGDKQEAMELIQKYKIEHKCTFTGEISGADKINAFLTHDLFIFPPVQPEGLPWVILEAMSAALPVVTTDQGAISEVVVDGESGFIVKPEISSLAERINYLFNHPEIAAQMGQEGRRLAEERFSERSCHEALKAIFQKSLSLPGRPAALPGDQAPAAMTIR
jgi:glycosyltransferase involved in cell wall biosynthesis